MCCHFLDLNFALSGYGGSNLDPFYGYGLDPNSPTKMSIPYFWLYIGVLSIPGWNLAKYFALLAFAFFTLAGMAFGIAFWDFCFQPIPFWVLACGFSLRFWYFLGVFFSLNYWIANAPV